ncbi:hypothetical protein PRZ48_001839 [Zasmidium cellare]|uniref:PH domain-containing protein n=1 Tax=Zasmidium cellare TaxID=395010 RepID=A0ABR0F460_ZASCE|nr:hypothetical protein PRZ48_001839 [Zasmidium cellare]
MSPFNLSVMGVESIHRRTRTPIEESPESEGFGTVVPVQSQDQPDTNHARTHHHHHTRHSRPRLTSHYSQFQTSCTPAVDSPPTYVQAAKQRPTNARSLTEGCEPLPSYSCTVGAEGKLLLNLESINPLSPVGEGEWREVYAVLRGTLLSFHRVKDGGAGKLLRTYTLQHAEVGLAPDAQHTILVPQTRLAHLIPSGVRVKAWQRDPDSFKPVRQSILRLRVETDQILLADSEEERIHSLIYALSAAIDISHAIDERSIPKQCTVPRRRRRQRPQFNGDLTDPALIAEQERIMRQVCPQFAGTAIETASDPAATTEPTSNPPQTPAREEEEIDMSMMREEAVARPSSNDGTTRPSTVRQMTNTTMHSAFAEDMMYATLPTNFNIDGKWQPPHNRSPAQVQRYIKRIMPVLLADAPRASDIVISRGQRMKINWRMELLEEWELQPPSYKSHAFNKDAGGLVRANSQRSAAGSASNPEPHSSSSIMASEDDVITPMETGMENLHLSKITSTSTNKGAANEAAMRAVTNPKSQSPYHANPEVHGVVFCF